MPSFSPSRLKKQNFCFYGLQKNLCTNFCVKSNLIRKKFEQRIRGPLGFIFQNKKVFNNLVTLPLLGLY